MRHDCSRKEPKQKILNEFNSGSEVKISMRTFEQYSKNWFPEKSLREKNRCLE